MIQDLNLYPLSVVFSTDLKIDKRNKHSSYLSENIRCLEKWHNVTMMMTMMIKMMTIMMMTMMIKMMMIMQTVTMTMTMALIKLTSTAKAVNC